MKMLIAHDKENVAEIEIEIKDKKLSISGTIGDFIQEDKLNNLVYDYWYNINLEDEFGYMADDIIGSEPSEDDIESYIDDSIIVWADNEIDYTDEYQNAYDEAYDKAYDDLKEKRLEYLEGLKEELIEDSYPFEVYNWYNDYVMTLHTCGQCDDEIREMIPLIDQGDFNYIMDMWTQNHLKEITPEIEKNLNSIMNRYNETQIIDKLIEVFE